MAARLPPGWEQVHLSWPGAGEEPPDPSVAGFDDLVDLARAAAEGPGAWDVVAQSMGGLVAIRLAARHPERVRRLVLAATSAGIDVAGLGGRDWRAEYRATYPRAASWVWAPAPEETETIAALTAPTLLLWGDADPISPVAVGRRLVALMAASRLEVIEGGGHDLAAERPDAVAALIVGHLA